MGKQDFEQYLRTHPATPGEEPEVIDWAAEKEVWLRQLDKLYQNVESWLADYQQSGRVTMGFYPIRRFEDGIGWYKAQEANISIGNALVKLVPIGTALLGVKGRVDLEGPSATVHFVLTPREATSPQIVRRVFISWSKKEASHPNTALAHLADEWVWKVSTNPPHIKYTDLTQDTFLDSLLTVIGGQEAD
jgi:hypothetical protein